MISLLRLVESMLMARLHREQRDTMSGGDGDFGWLDKLDEAEGEVPSEELSLRDEAAEEATWIGRAWGRCGLDW